VVHKSSLPRAAAKRDRKIIAKCNSQVWGLYEGWLSTWALGDANWETLNNVKIIQGTKVN
jgi:hypothetical protein